MILLSNLSVADVATIIHHTHAIMAKCILLLTVLTFWSHDIPHGQKNSIIICNGKIQENCALVLVFRISLFICCYGMNIHACCIIVESRGGGGWRELATQFTLSPPDQPLDKDTMS